MEGPAPPWDAALTRVLIAAALVGALAAPQIYDK
jgi:hypothetical protein